MSNGTPPIFVRSCSDDCDFVTVLRARVVELEAEVGRLRCVEQGSGELCPVCGWCGIRGDDGCAFCANEHAQGRMDPEWVVGRKALERAESEVRDLRDANALNAEALVGRSREVERLTKERDEALVWAKNWEAACEAKNKQLDEYDESVAASEMVAIEHSGCEAAMREMEIARGESRRMREERDEALRSCETWKRLARDVETVREQTYGHALDERSKVDTLRDQLREARARVETVEARETKLHTALEWVQDRIEAWIAVETIRDPGGDLEQRYRIMHGDISRALGTLATEPVKGTKP
jgi:hypothetical protein